MDFEEKCCPINDIDGYIENGKQFDLDIILPEDNRGVIFGTIKDCYKEPVKDAVVKLIEIDCEYGKEERKPVSHTITNKNGEFVFGPLCPDKKYDIQIWVNRVKHIKVCAHTHHEGKCLKGIELKHCDYFVGKKEDLEKCKDKCEHKKNEHEKYEENYYDKKEDCGKVL